MPPFHEPSFATCHLPFAICYFLFWFMVPMHARSERGLPLPMTPTILIIEDDDLQYEIYEEALNKYNLIRVETGSEALAQIPRHSPDLLILDHVLARGELGLDFLPEFKEVLPHVPIIIISGALEVHQQLEALQGPRRAHYCLTKPVDVHALKKNVAPRVADALHIGR